MGGGKERWEKEEECVGREGEGRIAWGERREGSGVYRRRLGRGRMERSERKE